jgi:hypothetical protein
MGKSSYYIDNGDTDSIEELISAFDSQGTPHEAMIRKALEIHNRPFILYVDHINELNISPLQDAFTFNMETDELVVFTDDPEALIDALLEMAMFLRGFNTVMGVDDEWKVQIAIGAWRHVRETLKSELGLASPYEKVWTIEPELETVEHYNQIAFGAMVFLASRSDIEVNFPQGTSQLCISAYRRLSHVMETIAHNIGIDDQARFNRRLSRALTWIEDSILPQNMSPFDDLFGPDGFSDKFFEDGPDN